MSQLLDVNRGSHGRSRSPYRGEHSVVPSRYCSRSRLNNPFVTPTHVVTYNVGTLRRLIVRYLRSRHAIAAPKLLFVASTNPGMEVGGSSHMFDREALERVLHDMLLSAKKSELEGSITA